MGGGLHGDKGRSGGAAIQVSYDISNEKTKQREINALVKAAEKFHCDNLLLINMDVDGQFLSKGHTVRIMLATDWLLS